MEEMLTEARVHFDLANEYASGDDLEQLVVDAVCMRLSAGIEVLGRLGAEVRSELFGDIWPLMWGMRNRIAHGYLLVDAAIVRQTIAVDLPAILQIIRLALSADADGR